MGIGLCEYRAAIGAFAWIAVNAGLRWRSKSKKQKSSRLRAVGGEESFEKGETFNSVQKRGRSLNRGRSRDRSGYVGQRSRTLNQREIRSRQHVITPHICHFFYTGRIFNPEFLHPKTTQNTQKLQQMPQKSG